MHSFFDVNKRFKLEPQELTIDEELFDSSCAEEIATNCDSFQYDCVPTTSAFVPLYKDAVPAILDGQFFEILTVTETTCTALCKLCEPRQKTINGSLKATGNFYDHIKRMHSSYMAEAETKRGAKRKPRSKKMILEPTVETDDLPSPAPPPLFLSPPDSCCSQEDAFNAIFEFACDTMHPISIVDSESFRNLIEVLSGKNSLRISIPSSQEVENCIQQKLSKMYFFLDGHLKLRESVCVTADLWKQVEGYGFIAICGHTIDPSTFERESFALAFRPVRLYCKDDIAKQIATVFSKYNIEKKVRSLVTHNITQYAGLHTEGDIMNESFGLNIPEQRRSFTYSLNLVVTVDVTSKAALEKKLPDDPHEEKIKEFARVYDSMMQKLAAFWNYLKNSPRAAEYFTQYCGKIPPIPTDEWSVKFEAMKIICETEITHKFLDHLTLPRGKRFLEKEDLDFIAEYIVVMQPFATAMEILKDAGSLTGTVLPTILSIKCRLEAMSGLHHGDTLRILALRGLIERFWALNQENSSSATSSLIATISHPTFKTCLPSEYYDIARSSFLAVCEKMSAKFAPILPSESQKTVDKDSFFSVLKSAARTVDYVSNEGLRYLTDDSEDLSMLDSYPWVKNIFLEFNTCLSSSAAVERLLGIANPMLCATSGIGDKHFEDCLLLKVNKHLY